MTMIDLDEIEARANAATPGPWTPQTIRLIDGVDLPDATVAQWQRDAAFIAHARTDVPALVARVRELEAECERMKTFAAQSFSAMIRQEVEQMREYGLSYEGVRKVLHEYNDGEISFGKLMDLIRAAARAMAEDNQRAASNLLAIIHGDGGHYEDAHGTVKACKDAEGVVSELRLKLDAATHALGLLYEETTDPSRCTVELCAGDYRHHISEPCRLAVKKALRQHSLGEKLKDLLPPDWNKPDGVEGLE
jgi:hypothetical protein